MRQQRGLSAILSLALILAAVPAQPSLAASPAIGPSPVLAARAQTYSGEALYRGLFFGEGDVGLLFPELAAAAQTSPQMKAARARLIAAIASAEPSFFDQLAASLYSGKPARVRTAIVHAQQVTNDAIAREFGAETAAPGSIGPDCIVLEFVVIGVAIAAVAVLVLLVNAAEYINLALEGNIAYQVNWVLSATSAGPAPASAASLPLDRWAARIVDVLGKA